VHVLVLKLSDLARCTVQIQSDASKFMTGVIIPVICDFFLSGARSEEGSRRFCYPFVICYMLIFWYKGSVFKCEQTNNFIFKVHMLYKRFCSLECNTWTKYEL